MRFFRQLIIIVFLTATTLVVTIACAPLYLPALLTFFLKDSGIKVLTVDTRFPSPNAWVLPKVELDTDAGLSLGADTVVLHYEFGQLLSGQLEAVDISNVEIRQGTARESVEKKSESSPIVPSAIVESLPFNRITIAEGNIDRRIYLNKLELQRIADTLRAGGFLRVSGRELELKAELNGENQIDVNIKTTDGRIELKGQVNENRVGGQGMVDIDVALLRAWLPEAVQSLSGRLNSEFEFDVDALAQNPQIDLQATLKGQVSLPNYFQQATLNQVLRITGPMQSPTLTLVAGDIARISQLQQPIVRDKLTIALSDTLTMENLAEGLNVEQRAAIQVRGDKDALDIVFNGKRVSINGQLPSINQGFYVSSELQIDSFSPLSVRVFSGGHVTLGNVGDFGRVVADLQKDAVVVDVDGVLRLDEALQLNAGGPEASAQIMVTGQLRPLDANVTIESDNLVMQKQTLSPLAISAAITQRETIDLSLTATVTGVDLIGDLSLNQELSRGTFNLDVNNLKQLNPKLAKECTEITSGRFSVNGNIALSKSGGLNGEFALQDFGIKVQNTALNNISGNGDWRYLFEDGQLQGQSGLQANAGKFSLPSVDIGLPVQDLEATLRYSDSVLFIDSLTGSTLGGGLLGRNQRWYFNRAKNDLYFRLENVDLRELAGLDDYPNLEVAGRVDITLPLSIDSDRVQVKGGRIESVGTGGQIRFLSDTSKMQGAQKEAFEALKNFHFSSLGGGIDGPLAMDPEGYLVSNLRLQGSNPDMGRSVSLNLNIEQNTYPIFQTIELFNKINRIGQCTKR